MPDDSSDLISVAEGEKALYAALAASDADAFADLFSDDVTYIHSTGIAETKAENIAGQRHGVHRHGPTATLSKQTRVFGRVAVTCGVIDLVDTAHGDPFTIRLRQTLIWLKEDGAWRLLVRQATRIPGDELWLGRLANKRQSLLSKHWSSASTRHWPRRAPKRSARLCRTSSSISVPLASPIASRTI